MKQLALLALIGLTMAGILACGAERSSPSDTTLPTLASTPPSGEPTNTSVPVAAPAPTTAPQTPQATAAPEPTDPQTPPAATPTEAPRPAATPRPASTPTQVQTTAPTPMHTAVPGSTEPAEEPSPAATLQPAAIPTPRPTASATLTPEPTPTPPATRRPTPVPSPTPAVSLIATDEALDVLESLPWRTDGLTSDEMFAYRGVKRIIDADPAVGLSLMNVPWFFSDIDPLESETITYISWLAGNDVAAAAKVIDFPWFADGIDTGDEAIGLRTIARISTSSPAIARELLDLPWLAARLGKSESRGIGIIFALASQESARQSFPLSRHVMGLPWFRDGVSEEEGRRLRLAGFVSLAVNDQESGEHLTGELETLEAILSLDPGRDTLDEGVLFAIEDMAPTRWGWVPEIYSPVAHLAAQPWFRDGFSDADKALIISLRSILRSGQSDASVRIIKQLIEHGTVLSKTMSTRSGGQLDVYVVSRGLIPPGQDIFGKLRSQISSPGGAAVDTSLNVVAIVLVDPELRSCYPEIQVGTVTDEQTSGAQSTLNELRDEFDEFRSDLTASIQTVYPGEIFEAYGAVAVAEALAPLAGNLQWIAAFDEVTKRWVVYDPGGAFTVEALPLPAQVPTPSWSTVGELTHLIPSLVYWVNVDGDVSIELGGSERLLTRGTNPLIW